MIAFVLSRDGSLGAIQAGMIEALLERDIMPVALVGTSIEAANAAFLAPGPTLLRARRCPTCGGRSSRAPNPPLPRRTTMRHLQARRGSAQRPRAR
jgi:NTE family protein